MKILFLLPYCPVPANSGNKNLTYNLLKHITRHAICDLVMLVDENIENFSLKERVLTEFPAVRNIWFFSLPKGVTVIQNKIISLFKLNHPGIGRYDSDDLKKALISYIKPSEYDLIHFDMIHMSQYWRFCGNTPRLLVASDAYSRAAFNAKIASQNYIRKLLLFFYGNLILNYEKAIYNNFDIACTVSLQDSQYLNNFLPKLDIKTIGIPIANEYVNKLPRSFGKNIDHTPNILCTGAISLEVVADATIVFLKEAHQKIVKNFPQVKITLLGRNPTKKLLNFIQQYPNINHINYVQDYVSFLNQNWVYVYPQRCSTGLQTKVQQAMALGLPVVGFQEAFGGLEITPSQHCLLCENVKDMTDQILSLIGDLNLRQAIGFNAAKHIRQKFSIDKVGNDMLSIYQQMSNDHKSNSYI